MASLNPGRQQRLLQRAAMRGARGRFGAGLRADRAPTLRVEGLESRVMLAAAPVITAPQIFGVRPGSPFLFDVTASGDRPMTFSAAGLPAGLTLNAQTGLITGSLTSYATYDLTVTATNPSGSDTQNFRIVVGDKIGLTPAMGWNSWTIFPTNLTQSIVQAQAAAMASSGLVNYGWSYINMDAGWEGGRTADGQPIRGNSNFPDMQGMADYIHSLNLKFGVYTVPQNVGYVGELAGSTGNNLWADAQQFAAWGVDYLKYDGDPPSQNDTIQAYQAMRASGRDIIMSASTFSGLSPSAAAFYFKWNQSVRTGPDITDAFLNVLNDGIIYQQNWLDSIGPGHWGDSDNLQLGVVKDELGVHPTKLTPNQQQSQVSIWVMNASPLLLGNDLTQLDAATLKWLTNEEVLAIDQDPLGIPSRAVNGNTSVQMRPLADGSIAVELLNVSNTSNNITISFSDLGLTGPQIVRDVWQKQDVGTFTGAYTATIGADGTALLVLRAATAGAPQITGQPINQYVDVGSPATFTVSATGAGLMYQWTKNGTAIPGAFGATYTTPNTTAADDGAVYRCIVTNLVGKVMSYEADLAVRGTTQYLSDYRYYFGTTGYYSIQNDHSVTGGVISIGGVTYSKGIGTHSPSEIDFYLGGKGGTFNADVGIDSNQPGFAKFQVFVDGVKVYDSGVLTGGMAPVPVSVDIRGAQVLSLVVANGAANNDYAQADWANARITTSLVPLTLPTVTSFARTTAFNTVQPFAPGDFTAAFSDVTPGQSLQNLKITSVPVHGALKLSGTTVVAGQSLTLAQVSNLTYVPANGYSGPDSFGWNGSDQIGYALVAATVNITVQTPPPPTAVPLMPVASASASGQTSIVLTWTDLSVSPNVASSYLILRSTDGVHFSQAATASASTSSITLSGLAAGTTYFFEVAGVNVIGNSPVSAAASTVTVVPPVLPAAPSTNFDYSSGFAPGLPLTYNGNTFLNTN
ncbi:MAG TPA: NPCBM/NEW2 domain-containing protein, partial [Phycisphaerae bacterium]|nr:NPCBM/NEW2 domain-containing protein [Phycisphaerae bacterium]